MNRRLRNQIFISCAISAVLTVAISFVDRSRGVSHASGRALGLARQIGSQAEGLTLAAQEKGDKDPVGWAVGFLAQGSEPRSIYISKARIPSGSSPEIFGYQSGEGAFDYQKLIIPETSVGVRVKVPLGHVGFLGTHTQLGSDFAFFLCFAVFAWFAFTFMPKGKPVLEYEDLPLEQTMRDWVAQAKNLLMQSGVHVREVVREAHNLVMAAATSRDLTQALREKIHLGISQLGETRRALRELDKSAAEADNMSLNLVLGTTRLGEQGAELSKMAQALHRELQRMRKLEQQSEATVKRLEIEIEPWATDADMAYHSYDSVFGTTGKMDGHIHKTSESLLNQAKWVKGLENRG